MNNIYKERKKERDKDKEIIYCTTELLYFVMWWCLTSSITPLIFCVFRNRTEFINCQWGMFIIDI